MANLEEEEDITLKPHIVITGNPGNGFTFHGPFSTFIAAADHMEAESDEYENDWWIAPLHPPKTGEEE